MSPPDDEARAAVTPRSQPLLAPGTEIAMLGLAAGEPSPEGPQIILATIASGPLRGIASIGPDGDVQPVVGVPVEEGAHVYDADVDCSAGDPLLCVHYWTEARPEGSACTHASIVRVDIIRRVEIFGGPPLRCPLAVEAAPGGDRVFVLDVDGSFEAPRVYRLDRVPNTDTYTPDLIADETRLPGLPWPAYGLAIAPVALPEPAASGGAAALGALAGCAALSPRGRRSWRTSRSRCA